MDSLRRFHHHCDYNPRHCCPQCSCKSWIGDERVITDNDEYVANSLKPCDCEQQLQYRAYQWLSACVLASPSDERRDQLPIERAVRRIVGSCSDPRPMLIEFIMTIGG